VATLVKFRNDRSTEVKGPPPFYKEHKIERRTGKVASLDVAHYEVRCTNGETITYDAALLARDGTPVVRSIPGAQLEHVFLLRPIADADAILGPGLRIEPATSFAQGVALNIF
jgi:NAD(P)H-nitrite reductase large subunit